MPFPSRNLDLIHSSLQHPSTAHGYYAFLLACIQSSTRFSLLDSRFSPVSLSPDAPQQLHAIKPFSSLTVAIFMLFESTQSGKLSQSRTLTVFRPDLRATVFGLFNIWPDDPPLFHIPRTRSTSPSFCGTRHRPQHSPVTIFRYAPT